MEKMSLCDLIQAKAIVEQRLEKNSLFLRTLHFYSQEIGLAKLQDNIAERSRIERKLKIINEQIEKVIDSIETKELDTPQSPEIEDFLIEEINNAADEWVFKTNGKKWSNNDDTAGDNFGSFVSGAKWMLKKLKKQE